MKIKITRLIILVTLIISFSCSTDEKVKEDDLLKGSWNLSALTDKYQEVRNSLREK